MVPELMTRSPVISIENVGKRYLVGHKTGSVRRYTALRDTIALKARQLLRNSVDILSGRALQSGDQVEEFWALRDVSFTVNEGEVVGIIGRNGAGKSTLLKILSRITEPTCGQVYLRGRIASLLEVGTGFHPELTGRENIFLNGAILGMKRVEIRQRFDEIVEFAGVEKFLDTPVKRYSSGMYVRLAFSVAAHLQSEILIVDEVLAVGDFQFQEKCLGAMKGVAQSGRTVLFVSHNMNAVSQLCTRCEVLSEGRVEYSGDPGSAIARFLNSRSTNSLIQISEKQNENAKERFLIRELELLDGDNVPASTFIMGQPLKARIRIQCLKWTARTEVGVKVSSFTGVSLHYLASSWEGMSFDLEPGEHVFEVTMPRVCLFPGKYEIGVWVGISGQTSDAKAMELTRINVLLGNITGFPTAIDQYATSGCEVYMPSIWKRVH